jgi:hypothetical protein
MSQRIEPKNHPISINKFDKELENIYIRIDTNKKYYIILVPPSYNPLDFSPQMLAITVRGLTTHRCMGSIEKGNCIKITLVSVFLWRFLLNTTSRHARQMNKSRSHKYACLRGNFSNHFHKRTINVVVAQNLLDLKKFPYSNGS